MVQSPPGARPTEAWHDPSARPFLEVKGITKIFPGGVHAVDDVSLRIFQGEFFSLLGASGCGKSTLLRVLAGLESPNQGQICIAGQDITQLPPYERPVNMMFQSYALFPHLTVYQNIAFGLRQQKMPARLLAARVEAMLELVHLGAYARRKPHQLSGGQRQRVALARALARQPQLLLLDEPLAALDRALRERTQFELVNIQEQVGTTFIMVTHDQEEAMTMSTRLAVMDNGRILQVGTPAEVYEYPANRQVAAFIGAVNLFEGRVVSSLQRTTGDVLVRIQAPTVDSDICMLASQPMEAGTPVVVAIRPEKISILQQPPTAGTNWVQGSIRDIAYLGDVSIYHVGTTLGAVVQVQVTNRQRQSRVGPRWEDTLLLGWEPSAGLVLPA